MLILSSLGQDIYGMKKTYSFQEYSNFEDSKSRADPANAWKISSDSLTMAGKLYINKKLHPIGSLSVDAIARIQFYWLENKVGEQGSAFA